MPLLNLLISTISLPLLLFTQPSHAAACAAEAFVGGDANGCHGQWLGMGNASGPGGTSGCVATANGSCILETDEVDGADCQITVYSVNNCNAVFLVSEAWRCTLCVKEHTTDEKREECASFF
jgi:hypothetical protein